MIFYKSKDFSIGLKIEINNEPYVILKVDFVNMGRGQAFNKLKLKNILTQNLITKTVKIGEKIKAADILSKTLKLLYYTEDLYYFFDEETNDYHEVASLMLSEYKKWLKEGSFCNVIFWNNNIIEIKSQKIVELKVIESNEIKKDLGTHKNYKFVKLETEALIKVPLFIKENDIIKIDTENGEYITRINT